MNVNLLIDNIVRQTTVLVAQLATAAGGRAPLGGVAGRVFLDLVAELKHQGLGNKVIADMFGLALRTYHDRVRRLSESATDRGTSLWSAVLGFVRNKGVVSRAEILKRFHADDEASVRGVLKDLVESGLLFKSGREDRTAFRAAADHELLGDDDSSKPEEAATHLVWVSLHQAGRATLTELQQRVNIDAGQLQSALHTLTERGHVHLTDEHYHADDCVIPLGSEQGWEAALFDHYQAMVSAVVNKLASGQRKALADENIGGSTFHFDLFPGHPLEAEVLGLLATMRQQASQLRARAEELTSSGHPNAYRVVFYLGQNVLKDAVPTLPFGVDE